MKNFLPLACACTSLIFPIYANAQDKYEEVVVTATMTETPIFEVLGSASVVTAQDIAIHQPLDFSDILESQVGLDVTRNGGRMSSTSLFTRGTNNGHTLILINGQRFSSATLGSTQFQIVDPELIERVEIVRGSRSAIYGSDAIGGVMQIFTKKPSEDPEGFLTMEGGSHSTSRFSAGISNSFDKASFSIALSHEQSDGIDSQIDDSDKNGDDDAYKASNGNLFWSYDVSEALSIKASHLNSYTESDYDLSGFFARVDTLPYSINKVRVNSFDVNYKPSDAYQSRFSVGHSVDHSDLRDRTYRDDLATIIETSRDSVYWQNDIRINESLLTTLAFDFLDEKVSGTTNFAEDARDTKAFIAQLQWKQSEFDIVVGGRHDEMSAHGGETTGNIAAGYSIGDNYRIYTSWAEGFKQASINDLYWPFGGNPELEPEESDAREFGVKAKFDNIYFDVSVYKTDIKNLIEWTPNEDFTVWSPQNVNEVEIEGVEFSTQYKRETWSVDGSVSYSKAVDADTDLDLINRARRKLTLGASKEFEKFTVGATFKAQGERTQSSGQNIGGYGVVGAYASFQPEEHLTIKLKINNLTDKSYLLNERYNEDGINGSVKAVFKF